jgi:hypothetical protein
MTTTSDRATDPHVLSSPRPQPGWVDYRPQNPEGTFTTVESEVPLDDRGLPVAVPAVRWADPSRPDEWNVRESDGWLVMGDPAGAFWLPARWSPAMEIFPAWPCPECLERWFQFAEHVVDRPDSHVARGGHFPGSRDLFCPPADLVVEHALLWLDHLEQLGLLPVDSVHRPRPRPPMDLLSAVREIRAIRKYVERHWREPTESAGGEGGSVAGTATPPAGPPDSPDNPPKRDPDQPSQPQGEGSTEHTATDNREAVPVVDPPGEEVGATPSTELAATREEPPAARHDEGATPITSRGIPLAEANVLVRNWLAANAKNAKDDPASITRDRIATETGVSRGQVSKTAAWQAFREQKTPGPREIPLTDSMLAEMPSDCELSPEVAALIKEQQAEKAEDERRHGRRHGPS